MKSRLTIIFLLVAIISQGQQIKFKREIVDTILIRSHRSVYQFDTKGTTKGEADYLYIVYDKEKQIYKINEYYTDKYTRTIRPDTIQIKKNNHWIDKKKINEDELQKFINSFDTKTRISLNSSVCEEDELKSLITLRRIKQVAKRYKVAWHFGFRYSSREENIKFVKECQSVDTFQTYLQIRFDTVGYAIVTDYSNTFRIWITTHKNEYHFEGKYPNPFKQPWYYHKKDRFPIQNIINLDINLGLEKILPRKFHLRETITQNALIDDYITWYLERRDVKF